jgi:hypothetical protein
MGKIEGNPRNLLQATLDNSIPTIRKDHKGHKEESRLLKVIQALLNLRTSSNSFSVFVTFVIFVYCKHPFFVCLGTRPSRFNRRNGRPRIRGRP